MRLHPVRLSVLALSAFILASPGWAQDVQPERARPKAPQVEVIRLQYAVADEIGPIVAQSLSASLQRGAKITPEARTNSLVVSGDESDVKDIRSLVATLDVTTTHGKAAPTRRSVVFELALFMLPAVSDAVQLPRTAMGVIDPSDPEAVLAKVRAAVGKGGVTEVAKICVTADDARPWKSRKTVQIPTVNESRGATTFGGYQEAVLDFALTSDSARGGSRRLAISCRIERFAEPEKSPAPEHEVVPPARQSNNLEFAALAEDGKLVMAAVESASSRFDGSYVLFVRVKE
jgi:hypothetical protein